MVTIAITGGIACGKSLVGRYLADMGVPVCEADRIGHDIMEKGGVAYESVVKAFGLGVVGSDGAIDRGCLAEQVFSDPRKRAHLNALTHPEIMRGIRQWIERQAGKVPHVAAIIPLLYEIADEDHWDVVVCVAAPAAEQRRRLMERGLTEVAALARIRAQLTQAEKMERARFVIYNCGSRELLREQTERVMRSLRGERS